MKHAPEDVAERGSAPQVAVHAHPDPHQSGARPTDGKGAPSVPKHTKLQKPKKGVRYIPALDGLRAIAVLAVIAYHLGLPGCSGGLMGVTVFFVISGYIVTKILLVEFSRTGKIDFKNFYIRRIKRLVPAILLVIVAVGALCTLFNHVLLTKMRPQVLPSIFFINNWWQIFTDASYFENIGLPSPLTHFWSLAIEEQFYLVLPLTLFLVLKFGGALKHRRNLAVFLLVLAALSALEAALLYNPDHDPTRVYYGTDTRAFSLLIGAFVAVITTGNRHRLPRVQREALAVIGVVGMMVCLSVMGGEDPLTYRGGMVICSAFTAMLIYGTLWEDSGLVAKILSLKPFIWIGKRSYGIYLWHYPLILLLTPANGLGENGWIILAIAVVLTFVVAALSYRYVENPIRYGIAKKKEQQAEEQQVKSAPAGMSSGIAARPDEVPIVEGLITPELAREEMPHVHSASTESGEMKEGPDHGDAGEGGARKNLLTRIPLKPAVVGLVAVLTVVSLWGFAFVEDTSALSDDGAAIILRGSMPGEPLTGEVRLATGDEEIQTLGIPDEPEVEEKPVYDILMIGDSVSLRAVPYFEERFPLGHLDAEKNRRLLQGLEVYKQYEADGQVGDTVIFALGTNGQLTEEELRRVVEEVGPDKQIYFVTVRNSDDEQTAKNNTALNQIRDEYSNVHLIDWNSLSAQHGDYFDGDGTHLTADAARIYVQFIADVLQYPTAEEVLAQAAQNGQGTQDGASDSQDSQ